MPYRNVYEEKNRRLSRTSSKSEEPERDLRKIAEIYKRQMPGKDHTEEMASRLQAARDRVKNAHKLNRGITK